MKRFIVTTFSSIVLLSSACTPSYNMWPNSQVSSAPNYSQGARLAVENYKLERDNYYRNSGKLQVLSNPETNGSQSALIGEAAMEHGGLIYPPFDNRSRIGPNSNEDNDLITHPELRKGMDLPDLAADRRRFGGGPGVKKNKYSIQAYSQGFNTPYYPYISSTSQVMAFQAEISANAYLDMPAHAYPSIQTLYTPALKGSNSSTLENVVVYRRGPLMNYTERFYGVWDHVNGKWVVYEAIDNSWTSKYGQYNAQYNTYFVKSYLERYPDGTWYSWLWNRQTNSWDYKYGLGGTATYLQNGWCAFEYYLEDSYCPSLPVVASRDIMYYAAGNWSLLTVNNWAGEVQKNHCVATSTNLFSWTVAYPNRYAWKVD